MAESQVMNKSKDEPLTIFRDEYQIPSYLIDEIDLNFDLQEDHTQVISRMRIRHHRLSQSKSRDLYLNGEELTLISVSMNGQALTTAQYTQTSQALILHNVPDNFELEIVTKIYPHKNTALSGLYRSANIYCTQCEAEGFRRITYFMDHPDILTRFSTTISADQKRYPYLLSNGNLVASGKLDQGRHFAKWEDPFNKPSYLFALVAGDFDRLEEKFMTASDREISLQIFVEKGYADQAHHAMHALKEAMRWDEKEYGREYDLDIYMIVATSDFNMGAMENKGLNIFNTKYVLAKPETATDEDYIHILSVVGHEYFHNWSGNRVTCRDWFQLSLKEGLTIFRDQSFSEDTLSRPVMRIHDVTALRESQFPEDAGPLAHPVRPESYMEINNFYTATVYNKGAEVLRMMQTILGKVLFRKGMDLYFARHDGQAVTIEDFVVTMEDVSGIDLHQFRLWYSQSGTPTLTVSDNYDANKKIYTLVFYQSLPATPGQNKKLPMHIPVRVSLFGQDGKEIPMQIEREPIETEKVLQINSPVQTFLFKNVTSRPVPSLLRNFTAPVKVNYAYSDADLMFLFKHDTDPFNRWEAGQKYAVRTILNLVGDIQQNKTKVLPKELIDIYQEVLTQNTDDKYFLSEMLALPSEKYIGEQMDIIEVDAIHEAREFVMSELARQLESTFLKVYQANHDASGKYEFNIQAIGMRQLKNRCLAYLMRLPAHVALGVKQFETALKTNMTDTLAALHALSNLDVPERAKALAQFYDTWKQDALVLDKWFAIQAASQLSNTLEQVKKLMHDPAFDIKNPNKVYALLVTFSYRNAINFHLRSGEGYVFLRTVVEQLDKLNPQVAARVIKPLTAWKRYDKERQALMRDQLEHLAQEKLSPDVYELVTKSLE